MKQVKPQQLKADEELLSVAKWTIEMLDLQAIVYGGNSLVSTGFDEFYDWAAAVRVAVARVENSEDSIQQFKRTHADVQLPQLKENRVVKQACLETMWQEQSCNPSALEQADYITKQSQLRLSEER